MEAIDDPRGTTILHAVYDAAGRVSWVEVQGGKSAFAYQDTTTRVVDGLNRTTVFHHAKSGPTAGVTDGVESPSGTFSQLSFDAAGRPVEVLRDGTRIASMAYDAEGRPISLRAADGMTRSAYGAHGLREATGFCRRQTTATTRPYGWRSPMTTAVFAATPTKLVAS